MKTEPRKQRGLFERPKGSGIWWIRYADASGRIRREKVGNKGAALKLYQKRKTAVLQGKEVRSRYVERVGKAGRAAKKGHSGRGGCKQLQVPFCAERDIAGGQRAAKMNGKKNSKKLRGIFEKVAGSGVWWIQYFDADGRRRREKAGSKSNAITLLTKRRAEVLVGKKLPEKLRARQMTLREIANATLEYSLAEKASYRQDKIRMAPILERFGTRAAEGIRPEEFEQWLNDEAEEREWRPATKNRYVALLKLTYRLAEQNGKIRFNPARLLRMRKENNGRVRFLNQIAPLHAKLDYLKECSDEESRLRAVIAKNYPEHLQEFEIALNSGMRPSEQYGLTWDRVDLTRKIITIPKSKNGKTRHIPLNSSAVAAFKSLQQRSVNGGGPVFVNMQGEPLQGYKHWFEPAVSEAGVRDFTWYCLRHTFASRLVMAGVDLRTVAELMGHQQIQMTVRYAHLAPAHTLAAVERLVNDLPAQHAGEAEVPQNKPTATRTATSVEAGGNLVAVGVA